MLRENKRCSLKQTYNNNIISAQKNEKQMKIIKIIYVIRILTSIISRRGGVS